MIISTFFDNITAMAQQNDLSLAQTAEECVRYGVTGIDIEDCEVADPRVSELLDAGMQIVGMPTRFDLLHSPDGQTVEKIVDLAVKYNVPRILMIPGFFIDGEDRAKAMHTAAEEMSRLCALAGKEGITVGVEDYDHIDAPTSTIDGMKWFLDQVPELSCFFDTGNFLFGGEDVMEAYRLMKHRITSQIHCKDRAFVGRPGDDPSKSKTGKLMYPCAVGSGILPIGEIIRDLAKSGFDGVFTAELFGTEDTLGDLKASAEYIQSCISVK